MCRSKEREAELEAENAKLRQELIKTKADLERFKTAFKAMSAAVLHDAGDVADAPSPAAEQVFEVADADAEGEPEEEATILCIGLKKGGQGEPFWFRIEDISTDTGLCHDNPNRGRKQTVIDMDLSTVKFAYRTAAASEIDEQRKAALPSTENFENNPWLRDLFNNVSYCYAAEAIHDYDGEYDQASELNSVKAEMTPSAFIDYLKNMLERAENEDGQAIVDGENDEDASPNAGSKRAGKVAAAAAAAKRRK